MRFFPQVVEKCTVVNRTLNDRVQRLVGRLSQSFGNVQFSSLAGDNKPQVEEAVQSADLIICATSSTKPLFHSSCVNAGTHIILIGSYTPEMQEVDAGLIKRSLLDRGLIVDSKEACFKEAGELIRAQVVPNDLLEIGHILPVDETGNLALETLKFRLNERVQSGTNQVADFNGPVTLFKSVGIGLQDVAIGAAVVSKAEELCIGHIIEDYDACSS